MLLGSHLDRPVRLEVRDGREVVVKTYRRGGSRQVHDDMLALWLSPFGGERRPPGLPEPLSVDPVADEVVMTRVPGLPLGGRGDIGDSVLRLPQVAELIADLHTSGATVKRVRSADRVLASCQRKAADLRAGSVGPGAGIGAVTVAEAALKVVQLLAVRCPTEENLVPGHGDFSPRNVLGDATDVVLIDLDRMQMADPLHDLAYWDAWIWATDAINDQVPSWVGGLTHLRNGYAGHLGSRPAPSSEALAFHQAAALLRIVHGWSALQARPDLQLVLLGEATRLLDKRS